MWGGVPNNSATLTDLLMVLRGTLGQQIHEECGSAFKSYDMRMSLALALYNPPRHAPIMKQYNPAGIMITNVKLM